MDSNLHTLERKVFKDKDLTLIEPLKQAYFRAARFSDNFLKAIILSGRAPQEGWKVEILGCEPMGVKDDGTSIWSGRKKIFDLETLLVETEEDCIKVICSDYLVEGTHRMECSVVKFYEQRVGGNDFPNGPLVCRQDDVIKMVHTLKWEDDDAKEA